MATVALYARVSSEKQAQANTIASQIFELENRISADGHILLDELKFIDNGYSGSYLLRPSLEKLRDKVAGGKIDKIYVHSPDRLSRKYAYQMILLEEFEKAGKVRSMCLMGRLMAIVTLIGIRAVVNRFMKFMKQKLR